MRMSSPDQLTLRGLRGIGRHGVLPAERESGQVFVVDAVLSFDTRAAATSDDLADTVDYGLLARRLIDVVEGEPVDLIETLAERLASVCLADERVQRVRMCVHKPDAPITVPFEDVVVTLTRSRATTERTAVVALGSNLGDRLAWLQRGVDLLATHDDVVVRAVSPVYETEPVGGPAQGSYLNAVAIIGLRMPPRTLLGVLHVVEAACDRVREVRFGPRTLDLDIVAAAAYVCAEPTLTLPHPRAHERAFVLAPWADVEPDAVLVGHGRVAEVLRALDRGGIRRRDHLVLRLPG